MITNKKCDAASVKLYIAGPITVAEQIIRGYVMKGLCVNIYPTKYIYTGGEEAGYVVEFINYARFPSNGVSLLTEAVELGALLMEGTYQKSFTILTRDESFFYSRKEEVASNV